MKHTNPLRSLFLALLIILFIIAFLRLVGGAIDNSIDRQNTMLCNSAQVSGNEKYLKLCREYYKTGDITYMRELPL